MVDRRRRDQFAEILRHFAAGLLTNVEYEKRVDDIFEGMSRKQAIRGFSWGARHVYQR